VTIPECSCRRCCRALVRRYAPPSADPDAVDLAQRLAGAAIVSIEDYAAAHGLTVETVRKQAAEREVTV
jgi:hypothetical protein